MERLTNENHKGLGFVTYNGALNPYAVPLTIGELAGMICEDYSPRKILGEVLARLAAYEDTGLEPEEILMLCSMDKRARMADLLREEENRSLTLEDLREMDGEPVWVTFPKCPEASGWMLISASRHCVYDGLLGDCDFENCGKLWVAYRRKPEATHV